MRVHRRAAGGVEFILRQQLLKRLDAGLPALLDLAGRAIAESRRQAAPANVAGQGNLLFGRGAAALGLQGLDDLDRAQVVVVLLDLAALAKPHILGDAEVGGRDRRGRLGRAYTSFGSGLSRMYSGSTISSASSSGTPFRTSA